MAFSSQSASVQLQNAFSQNRLSHAYILSGQSGLGKTDCAKQFAKIVLCEKNNACGKCRGCLLMQADNHPDFLLIHPEEKSKAIKIDQIREMTEKLGRTAHAGGYQVVIISPADSMPVQAANALLKTLEEPSGKVILFLIDNQKSILPATILSRCQKLLFSGELQVNHALRDQLLQALEQIQSRRNNPIALASNFLKTDIEAILQTLILIASDLTRLQLNVSVDQITNKDIHAKLLTLSKLISPLTLQIFLDKLLDKKRIVSKGINLNQQLCIEDILIEWGQETR